MGECLQSKLKCLSFEMLEISVDIELQECALQILQVCFFLKKYYTCIYRTRFLLGQSDSQKCMFIFG